MEDPDKTNIQIRLEFFGELLGELGYGVLLIEKESNIIWINQYARTMNVCCNDLSNFDQDKPINITSSNCIDCPLSEACLSGRQSSYCTKQVIDQKHQARVFSILSHPIPADTERQVHIVLFKDTTEDEGSFRERQELQMVLTNVLDNTVDAVITMDLKGIIHSWNRGAWQTFGYIKEEMKGAHVGILLSNEQCQKQFDDIQKLLEEKGFVRNHRAMMVTKEGRIIDVAVTQTTMHNREGERFGHSLIIRDISKVVHLEKMLSHKVIQLTKLLQMDDIIRSSKTLEDIYNVILVAVTAGEGLRFNRAFLLMYDSYAESLVGVDGIGPSSPEEAHQIYSRHNLEAPTLSEIILQRQQLGESADQAVKQLVRQIEISFEKQDHPLVRCLKENRPFLYLRGGTEEKSLSDLLEYIKSDQFVAVPLVWQAQQIGVIIADNSITRRDISMEDVQFLSSFAIRAASGISSIQLNEDLHVKVEELKNAYQELTLLQETFLKQERLAALGEMAGKVAHEIRNPLSAIGGFARLLLNTSQSEEDKKFLNIIANETKRLEQILSDVLGYVRSEGDDISPQDLNSVLDECRMIVEQQAKDKQIHFDMMLDQSLPVVPCNQSRLRQAFLNIMQNAVDAIGRSGVVTVRTGRENGSVQIQFEDTGAGIKPDDQEKLFEPFFSTKTRGIGLGLNITKQIIDQHQGQIKVNSVVGVGTKFKILLPMEPEEVTHD